MLISMLFVGIIIIVYGFIGFKKGGIKSIGGLISMILSFILSRCLAIPVTQYVCNENMYVMNRVLVIKSVVLFRALTVRCF